jgi:anti-sigma factor RsiW
VNCRKIQSILSAYLDGELTGEEMIAIREHLSICQTCSDEHVSLQVVKKLLGSLDTVDADGEWPSTITARAYAGSRPWWEKAISLDSLLVHFGTSANAGALTPRGIRMARALALSTVVVFLAAVPISSIELLDQGVTGRCRILTRRSCLMDPRDILAVLH